MSDNVNNTVDNRNVLAMNKRMEMLRDLIMRQTDYTEEQAMDKIKEHKGDVVVILREYMGPAAVIEERKLTVNQTIYKEMRGMMDDAAATHRLKAEFDKRKEAWKEQMIKQREIAANNLRQAIDVSGSTNIGEDKS